MSPSDIPSSAVDASRFACVVGIDIGSQTCDFCVLKPDQSQVSKSTEFANTRPGFELLQSKLAQLAVPASQVLIGLEATSRYGENLYHFLENHGYQLCLLHPRQTHQFTRASGLACEDRSSGCHDHRSRVAESGKHDEATCERELIATYRELVRVHSQLSDEVARDKNEIQALLSVLFPEFTQATARPCRATAVALLKLYPSAQAMAAAGVEAIATKLHESLSTQLWATNCRTAGATRSAVQQ